MAGILHENQIILEHTPNLLTVLKTEEKKPPATIFLAHWKAQLQLMHIADVLSLVYVNSIWVHKFSSCS